MRLINTETGLMEDFIGDDIPEYAILSHTWEKDEISLQEFQRLTDPDFADDPKTAVGKAKAGFIKIKGCVQLAASRGITYAWIDTCCIDKTSSADLTESINSMYRWYANSKVCFAYLVDVQPVYGVGKPLAWQNSRWFSRGWTLQELIAPSHVEFFFNSWDYMGSRGSWAVMLSNLTGIPVAVLETNDLSSASVAQKMSWASHRKTTRREDMAYCLLGLFDINMPLLYGEGEKAFLRLQEHITASSTDHSLFAWGVDSGSAGETLENIRSYRSIFARSPADFAECGDLVEFNFVRPESWTQTNRGFHAVLPTFSCAVAKQLFDMGVNASLPGYIDDTNYLVVLNCRAARRLPPDHANHVIGIWVSLVDKRDDGKHGFCRVTNTITLHLHDHVEKLFRSSPDNFLKEMWLATTPRTLQVPFDYFSKRLGGYLIPKPSHSHSINLQTQIDSLYDSHVSSKGHILPCPLLPLNTNGGFVGAVTIGVAMNAIPEGVSRTGYALIAFGFPPSLAGPFLEVFGDIVDENYNDSHRNLEFYEDPLGYGLQRFVELENDGSHKPNARLSRYPWGYFKIDVLCEPVFHTGMVFMQLNIRVLRTLDVL
jgi:hypothetical protein